LNFKTLEQVEIEHIRLVLSYYHFNTLLASKALGITDRTIRNKLRQYPELKPTEKELELIEIKKDLKYRIDR